MISITEWAVRWNVSPEALADLRASVLDAPTPPPSTVTGPESLVMAEVRLEASRMGYRLWRNNVGAGKLENGSFLRWGLCNESAQMNHMMKSSDLIGISPDGQFVARECKAKDWVYTGTPREVAQRAFIDFINARGGDAAFATGEGTLS